MSKVAEPSEQLMRLAAHYHEAPYQVLLRALETLYQQTWSGDCFDRVHFDFIELESSSMAGKMDKLLHEFLNLRVFYTELLAAAFLNKFPGIEPDECEIVTEWGTGNVTITVRKRR